MDSDVILALLLICRSRAIVIRNDSDCDLWPSLLETMPVDHEQRSSSATGQ